MSPGLRRDQEMSEHNAGNDKGIETIRSLLSQASGNLEHARMNCLLVHPVWQTIEVKLQEALNMVEETLETVKRIY
jgi:hypothetical protein